MNKRIKISSVKPEWRQVSFNNNGTWENYKFQKKNESMMSVAQKHEGEYVHIEYHEWTNEETGKTSLFIDGITPEGAGSSDSKPTQGGGGSSTDVSIQKQVCIKAIAEVVAAGNEATADIGKYIGQQANALYAEVFEKPSLDEMKKKVEESLGAEEIPPDDNPIPF